MIDRARLDAWITREPDWFDDEPPALKCRQCGAFLRREPERTEHWEDAVDCDGSETLVVMEYSDSMVAILGEEFRGKTYTESVSPCGIEVGMHASHREVLMAGETRHRTCRRCGAEDKEALL